MRALNQWWKIALPLSLILATTAVAIAWMSFELTYRASALLQIKSQQDYIAFQTGGHGQRFEQTQVELLRSPIVLERLLSNEKIAKLPEISKAPDPVAKIKQNLSVRNLAGSEIFEVSYQGPSAENAAMIVNAIVDSYMDITDRDSDQQRLRVLELLEKQKELWTTKVRQARETVKSHAMQITGTDPFVPDKEKEVGPKESPLSTLQGLFIRAEVDKTEIEAEIMALNEALDNEKWEISGEELTELIESNSVVQELKKAIEKKESLLAASLEVGRHKETEDRYRAQIAADQQKLDEERTRLREKAQQRFGEEGKAHSERLKREKNQQLAGVMRRYKILKERLDEMLSKQTKSRGDAADLAFARVELENAEGVFRTISNRVLALNTEVNAPDRVVSQRSAPVPRAPEEKSPLKTAGLAGIAGFALPFVLAIAWEKRVKRIIDTQQILQESHLPVAGEVAALPMRRLFGRKRGARNLSRARYVFEESIDSLRTSLVLSDDLRDVQVIAVVSSVSREGKTSLSAQLAVSLARACAKPVLVIDADIRSPDIHQIFDVPLEPGLVKVLGGLCQPHEAIQRGPNQLVHVLPAGRLLKSPHTLMGHGALKALVNQFRADYQYIVIDTPPVLSASESLVVAKAADGALLCTLRETSRAPQVKLTYERLMSAGANVIGVVLSGVPTSHYAHKYGSYAYMHQ